MEFQLRTINDELRKTATYDEVMALDKVIKRLPTMNEIRDLQEQFAGYAKAETYERFHEQISAKIYSID